MAYGVEVAQTSWLMHEFKTLQTWLWPHGRRRAQPVAVGEHAILMRYYGDVELAAPTLSEVRLDRDEAEALFAEALCRRADAAWA